ncbi:MAG: PAS domain-containing protein, partial [Thermodesulfobacteriota bacterium]|nr:PAS domain-containing protein [Thermodesulfobacteriota bacterium]
GEAERECRIIKPNGSIVWVNDRSKMIYDENHQPISVEGVTREITERKQAEEELMASEEKLSTILDSMPDVILQLDTNLEILWANKATIKLNPRAVGQLCYKALPGINDVCPGCPIVKALKTGQIERGIVHLQSVTGVGESYWDDIGIPIKDAQGKVTSIVKLARNITEKKKAEEALNESNENYQKVVSNITTVSWKADIGENGAFENTYSSPVLDELLELPAGTMKNDWDKYFRYIKPEYLEQVNNAFKEAIKSPGKKIDCEYEVLKDNGQTAWFHSKGRCFEKNGKLHVFGSTTDITERKQAEEKLRESEEKYRLLADNSMDVIWKTNLKLVFTYISPSVINIFGFTVEEWVGTRLSQHASTKEFFNMAKKALYAIKHYKTYKHVNFEAVMLRKDGTEISVEINSKLLFNQKGLPIGFQGTTRDITERKKAEGELKKRMTELEIFNDAAVDRELKIIEHRKEINELLKKLGKDEKYEIPV